MRGLRCKDAGFQRVHRQALSTRQGALVHVPGRIGPGHTSWNCTGRSGECVCGRRDGFPGLSRDITARGERRDLERIRRGIHR